MRIAFAGTPEFAAYSLKSLIVAKHDVVFVLTQPDRPSGRGMKLLPSSVKQVALENGLTVHQPLTLSANNEMEILIEQARLDCMIVAAYGLLLPQSVLTIPRFGCLNIHASLLPRWRGAAPIQRAILAGDKQTGINIMQMDAGLDTGPILLSEVVNIDKTESTASLHEKLKEMGASLIVSAMDVLKQGSLKAIKQRADGITYAEKIKKDEAVIDWSKSASQIEREIRAFNPFPVSRTSLGGELIKIWSAVADDEDVSNVLAGKIISRDKNGVVVACGKGVLKITELQSAGGKRLNAATFLMGNKFELEEQFV